MPRTRKLGTPAVIAVTLALVPGAAASEPVGQAAKHCKVDQSPGALGPTYTRSMSVVGVSCKDGRGLIRRWDKCRKNNGGKDGRCKRVFRFRCREKRSNAIPTQYDSRVRCKRGGDRVRFKYTQFT